MRIALLRRAPRASFSMDVYADSLVKGLKSVQPKWEIIELFPFQGALSLRQHGVFSGGRKYYERYWRYPRSLRHLKVDICHIVDQSDGDLCYWLNRYQIPNVVTCHDLINLIKPETFKGRSSFPLISLTAWKFAVNGMKTSDHVVTVSSYTKQDTIEYLGIHPECITVVPNAVDSQYFSLPCQDAQRFRLQQGISSATLCLLNVGSNNPRKNIFTILQVLARLKAKGIPVLFWKAGADFTDEQRSFIKKRHLEQCATHLGQPSKEMLVKFYNAADILLAPSTYEGFGLSALEAMACGTPVVTANVTSIPEVVGDAAILTDPLDVEAITNAIEQLYHSPNERNTLAKKGIERAQHFTWEKTAAQTAKVYEQVMEKRQLYSQ